MALGVPQVVQGLDVLSVVHVVRILLGRQVEAANADVVWQQQHRWVSCREMNGLIKGNVCNKASSAYGCRALTLGSALRPVRLTEGKKPVSAKTLVAALRVLALLRTRVVHLALIHICFQKQEDIKEEKTVSVLNGQRD